MIKKITETDFNLPKFIGYFLAVILLFIIFSKLIVEYRTVYIHKDQSIERINYLTFFAYDSIGKVLSLFSSREIGLDQVRIYADDKVNKKISLHKSDLERSWLQAEIQTKGKLKNIDIRGRGSNPSNWMFDKKSYKVKLPKKNVKNYIRKYDYVIPRNPGMLGTYLGYFIAEKSGILAPKARLVELFMNDQSKGVFIEVESLGEGFLRKNNIMPVDLYVGDSGRTNKIPYLTGNLLTNISMWEKSAYFNQYDEANNERLKHALRALNMAQADSQQYEIFKEIFDLDSWAKYSAYQALVQSWHNYEDNNLTLIYDHWRGKIIPVSFDTMFDDDVNQTLLDIKIILDNDPTLIDRIYNDNTEFLIKKYQYLKQMVENGVIDDALLEIDRIENKLIASWSRDENKQQHHIINDFLGNPFSKSNFISEINNVKLKLKLINDQLIARLNKIPVVTLKSNGKELLLGVDSEVPVENVAIKFVNNKLSEKLDIYYDLNGNNTIDKLDIFIPSESTGNLLNIKAIFASNRSNESKNNKRVNLFEGSNVSYLPTIFRFLTNSKFPEIKSILVNGESYLTDELNIDNFISPNLKNVPFVLEDNPNNVLNLKGNIIIKEDIYFNSPVVIHEGTNISIYPNVSMYFNNKVTAIGSVEKPINVKSFSKLNWGTFAIIGPKTEGSILSNISIMNGSGSLTKSTQFTSALSIHDTSNIQIKNCIVGNNSTFDDLFHIVYSSKVYIDSCTFKNAYSDAIDIDLSEVSMTNILVIDSGNDAIDLMGSNAYIKDSVLKNSNDKGVSVGEASRVLIVDTLIDSNIIGLEAKDKSIANIIGGSFVNNDTQFSAYSKNWRYGGGGKIHINSTNILSNNIMDISKGSELDIVNSFFEKNMVKSEKRVKIKSKNKNEIKNIASLSSHEVKLLEYWSRNELVGGYSYVR